MKRFSTVGPLLTGVLALSAPTVFAQPASARCVISSFRSAPASPQRTRRFSANAVLELRPIVTLAPGLLRPGSTLEVRFFTPTGNLYEARTFNVPTEENAGEGDRRVQPQDQEGHGEAEDRENGRPLRRDGGHDNLSRNDVAAPPLLVGGTSISSSSIFGTWRAEIWTGAGTRRPACASTFEIMR